MSTNKPKTERKRLQLDQMRWLSAPSHPPLDELLAGRARGVRMVSSDFEMLEHVFRFNFTNPREAVRLGSSRTQAHVRLGKLYEWGLLDRAWRTYDRQTDLSGFRERRVGGWVYTLSAMGHDFLARTENEYVLRGPADWRPRSSGHGFRKENMDHELKCNAVCLSLLMAGRAYPLPTSGLG